MTLPIEDELARRGITLKRVRPDLSTCPCPKCGQRLNVFPRRNAFACSGCGKGGDSADMFITFLDGEKAKPKTNGNSKTNDPPKQAATECGCKLCIGPTGTDTPCINQMHLPVIPAKPEEKPHEPVDTLTVAAPVAAAPEPRAKIIGKVKPNGNSKRKLLRAELERRAAEYGYIVCNPGGRRDTFYLGDGAGRETMDTAESTVEGLLAILDLNDSALRNGGQIETRSACGAILLGSVPPRPKVAPVATAPVAAGVAPEPQPIIVHTSTGTVEAITVADPVLVLSESDIKAEIERLASLSDLQYQTMRETSARALNIRVSAP